MSGLPAGSGAGKLFVFSAPSGAGKSTLKDALLRVFPSLAYSVSATTRKPRPGEVEGVHYFFKSPDEFKRMIEARELVEYMQVHGNFYGTPRKPLLDALARGRSVILDLDVYGKVNFDREFPGAVGILILPPDLDELERRLVSRATDDPDTVKLRLYNATMEMEFARERGKYEYRVVNDDFDRALGELRAIFAKELGERQPP